MVRATTAVAFAVAAVLAGCREADTSAPASGSPSPDGGQAASLREATGAQGCAPTDRACSCRARVAGPLRRWAVSNELRALLEAECTAAADVDASGGAGGSAPSAERPDAASGWLAHLASPADFPPRDDAFLRAVFDYNTKLLAGRMRFQTMRVRCDEYAGVFETAYTKYGAPRWMNAIIYQESACEVGATSAAAASGLWQLTPDEARAYGLRMVEGVVDERLSPAKSTEAAVHLLVDLRRALGSWERALAGYELGAYRFAALLEDNADDAGLQDLAREHRLPEDALAFVQGVEAFALILTNDRSWRPSGEDTWPAEVEVHPGTRLSLVARAASTSTVHLRTLNPDFLRDEVTDGEGTVVVPPGAEKRASAFFASLAPDDEKDRCVPRDFDWGRTSFEKSRFASCDGGEP